MTDKDKRYYDTHHDEILRKKALYREKNREKIRERDRQRYLEDPEKFKKKSKKHRDENPEKVQNYLLENREKILERNRIYNEEHKEEKQEWYQQNKQRANENSRKWRAEHPQEVRTNNKRHRVKTRDELFKILGGKICVKCGEIDIACLIFDHKNGGGHKDNQKHNGSKGLYRFYVKNPDIAKETLQVLCSNCNLKKKRDNNENPHQNEFPPID